MRNRILKIAGFTAAGLLLLILVFANLKGVSPLSMNWHRPVNQAYFGGKAINGYDPVAYFNQRDAVAGSEQYSVSWNGADWYFSSEANKQAFQAAPEQFAPKFGGYCSFAVSKGFTAYIDPAAFEIFEGNLYLFADQNVRRDWLNGQPETLKQSERNWR